MTAEDVIAQIRNEQVTWLLKKSTRPDGTVVLGPTISVEFASGTPALFISEQDPVGPWRRKDFRPDELIPLLFVALEDPTRCVVAQELLSYNYRDSRRPSAKLAGWSYFARETGDMFCTRNGLGVTLHPSKLNRAAPLINSYGAIPPGMTAASLASITESTYECRAEADFTQIPTIVNAWHWRLDREVVSIREWQIIAGALFLPAVWLIKLARQRLRKLPHQCRECGYDLRGNLSGVCPECGTRVSSAHPLDIAS
jgi:hypothetical protein